MPADPISQTNPQVDEFSGNSPGAAARRFFHATRPKFFPASVLPVLAGTAWGFHATGALDLAAFALALLATVCVHAGCNVLNDVGDDSGGTDRQNEDRIYPYTGGSRFIQTGILNAAVMAWLGTALLVVAAIAGLVLIALKGIAVLYFGIAGIALGVLYSLGPLRLSSIGLGETAVAIAFGVIPVAGAAWLQGASIDGSVLLFSLPVSFWVAAILLINEVPDIEADRATGKGTLPVRMGLTATAVLYICLHISAAGAVTLLSASGALLIYAPLLPILLLIPAGRAAATIRRGMVDRGAMTRAIESTLGIHTAGSLWLCGCILFS